MVSFRRMDKNAPKPQKAQIPSKILIHGGDTVHRRMSLNNFRTFRKKGYFAANVQSAREQLYKRSSILNEKTYMR